MFNIYATDYAPVDPITPPCDIVPIFIGYKGENKARCLIFDLTECVETFGDGGFVISFIRQGDDLPYLVTDTDRLDNNAIWIITDTDTAVDGYGMVQLQYIVDDVVCKSALYRTVTFDSNSITGDVPDPYEDLLAQIAAYAAQAEGAATTATAAAQAASTAVENGITTERSQRIAADEGLNTRINELMGLAGAPSMANSAAAMTDSSKIYVYTGSEAGYINGHWYYYNGTEWADGGVYQATAVDTDKTLTVENMAADAAVVGDRIDECMAAFVTETVSGSIASFADGADGVPLKDLVVNITAKQSGTGDPGPTNIRSISGWTEANISVNGKNFLPISAQTSTINGVTYTVTRDAYGRVTEIDVNGTASGNSAFYLNDNSYHFIAPGSYIMSGCTDSTATGVHLEWYYKNASNGNTGYKRQYAGEVRVSLSDFANTAYISQFEIVTPNGVTASHKKLYPMLRLATDADNTFEPYDVNAYNVSFGSAGTVYEAQLDVLRGMLTVTHTQFTLNSLPEKTYVSARNQFVLYGGALDSTPLPVTTGFAALSDTFTNYYTGSYVGTNNIPDLNFALNLTAISSGQRLVIKDTAHTSMDAFIAAYGNAQFVVPLAQPVSYQLTPTEVKSLLANNNIWSDTGSVASCEYRADAKLYLEKLTNPDSDMVADSNITSGQYFMVGNSLYLATANIANGGAITPGTNCTATNLAAALNAINS